MLTLREFTEDNAHRFWAEGKHLEDCKQQIFRFCRFGDHDSRSISDFKASDVFKFTDSLMVAGLKVSTINRYKCALKKIFREAVDMEECTKAPIIKLSKATKGRVRFYTKEEVSEIIDLAYKLEGIEAIKFYENNIKILDILHCPHSPNNKCECRKPKSGMFEMARDKHMIDMSKSWSIGDKETDIEASSLSGISNTILVRSGHKIQESKSQAKYFLKSIKETMKIITR